MPRLAGDAASAAGDNGCWRRRTAGAAGRKSAFVFPILSTLITRARANPQYNKILDYIETAKNEGAQVALGGCKAERPECDDGWFVEPTIFIGVTNDMRIAQEEVFGPVLSVIPFEDKDEAVAIGNGVVYGLAAGVWTQSIPPAITMAERLQAGTVWVNTYRTVSFLSPFGGYKHSGLGRESGQEIVKEYMQVKSVWLATTSETPNPFILR